MYAEICFPIFINKTFTYFVPKNLESNIDEGSVVNVTFNNQICKLNLPVDPLSKFCTTSTWADIFLPASTSKHK